MFLGVSLTDEDTATLLAEFRAQALDPHGLMFRGHIVDYVLSGVVELGLRDAYEANQGHILLWLLRHPLITSVDKSSLYEYRADNGHRGGAPQLRHEMKKFAAIYHTSGKNWRARRRIRIQR